MQFIQLLFAFDVLVLKLLHFLIILLTQFVNSFMLTLILLLLLLYLFYDILWTLNILLLQLLQSINLFSHYQLHHLFFLYATIFLAFFKFQNILFLTFEFHKQTFELFLQINIHLLFALESITKYTFFWLAI